jgi:hypothetical protein
VIYTSEQREILLEFLLFHVLAPLNETQEALEILSEDKTLSVTKKEVWWFLWVFMGLYGFIWFCMVWN